MKAELYVYALPKCLEGHKFSDSVAVTYANSLEEAISIFDKLYGNASVDSVQKCNFNDYGISILTDY